MTPNGAQSTFASGLENPLQLVFNCVGNLFVLTSGGSVYEFAPNGQQGAVVTGLDSPQGLVFDYSGNLFVSQPNGDIIEIATNGTQGIFAFGFSDPVGLAFDNQGDLFVANRHANSVIEIDTNGDKSTFASGLSGPSWLVFDSVGDLFVGNAVGNIIEINTNQELSTFASGLDGIAGLAFDATGNLFEADENSGNIYEFTPDGTRTTYASGSNYGGLTIQFLPELQAAMTNGHFQISVSMPSPYYSTMLQASINLINWCNLSTNSSPFVFTDSVPSQFPYRFFRAATSP